MLICCSQYRKNPKYKMNKKNINFSTIILIAHRSFLAKRYCHRFIATDRQTHI